MARVDEDVFFDHQVAWLSGSAPLARQQFHPARGQRNLKKGQGIAAFGHSFLKNEFSFLIYECFILFIEESNFVIECSFFNNEGSSDNYDDSILIIEHL